MILHRVGSFTGLFFCRVGSLCWVFLGKVNGAGYYQVRYIRILFLVVTCSVYFYHSGESQRFLVGKLRSATRQKSATLR